MKMKEFELLPEARQAAILYRQGVYIGKRKSGKRTVLLYQLESFYIEVSYLVYRRYISQITCSPSTDILNPYLEQILVEAVVD